MRRLLVSIILAVAALTSTISCNFDHLHYETSLLALVRIDIDWDSSHITPNGVSAYVYDAEGDLYSSELSSDPYTVYLKLPEGSYTVVLHNNSISELSGVELKTMTRLETSSIYATERSDEPSFDVVDDYGDMLFVDEPDDVVSCTLRDIVVSASDIEYHYYKPDISDYEQEVSHVYEATPLHIVHMSRIIAHIGGLEYALGAPKAILRGMSGGYNFDLEGTTDGDVKEEFSVNTRVTKADGDEDEDDTIYVDYNTFGMHQTDPEDQHYYLDIRFWLIDGSYVDYHIDITDDIRTETTEYQNLHIVELELDSLPEVSGGDDPEGGEGTFDPSLDDWVDVLVDLNM